MESFSLSRFIYFVPYTKTAFYKFDTETLQVTFDFEPDNATIGYGPNVIPLDAEVLFVQGGVVNGEFISDCFFLYLENKELEEKPGGPINGGAAYTLFDKNIYIFGGASRDVYVPIELCHKFNLDSETWQRIADLPNPSYNNSCEVWSNKIGIVGQHLSNLIYYDAESNTFSRDLAVEMNYKILLVHGDSLYIVSGDNLKVLKDGIWKDYKYAFVDNFTIVYSYSVYRNGYIYFVHPPQNVSRLNVGTNVVTKCLFS